MSELEELTDLFRKLGADDPEGWASSQVTEGINQIARFVFLKEAWERIIDENDDSWIDAEICSSEQRSDAPFAGIGQALTDMIRKGVDRSTITDLVRGKQAELLFNLCCLLDGPEDFPVEVGDMQWRLFQIDDVGLPIAPIPSLHESVLDTDPTGREMRPRNKG